MREITDSVGHAGDNEPTDVRVVQELLNKQDLTPLSRLAEDGRCGPATIEAIRHFQARSLGIQSPDGRVDPGGRTLRALNNAAASRGAGSNPETRRADRSLRAERVDSRVQESDVTSRIIDALVPRFGNLRAKIIGGYLSDSDQFWKVNYHWEYLLQMVNHSLTLSVGDAEAKELRNIASNLTACRPSPDVGYVSSPIGKPDDRSSYDEALRRYGTVRNMKESFAKVVDRAQLKAKSTKSPTMFDLAIAPVAQPGSSKHGSGYALDIAGDNSGIKSLCKSLGATLVFDEKSHVHVEFKNGVG